MSEYTFTLQHRSGTGRYYANIYDAATGWRTNLSLLTTDRSVARQRISRWERMAAREEWDPREGRPREDASPPWSEAARKFLAVYKKDVRPSTWKQMRSALDAFGDIVGPDTPVGSIRSGDCLAYLQSLTSRKADAPPGSASEATRRARYAQIRRAMAHMVREGWMKQNAMAELDRPQSRRDTFHVLTPADATRLVQAVRVDVEENTHLSGRKMYAYALELALTTGCRARELTHLTWGRVDTRALEAIDPAAPKPTDIATIRIDETDEDAECGAWKPKTPESIREILVYPRGTAVLAALWQQQSSNEDPAPTRCVLRGSSAQNRMGYNELQRLVQIYTERAGLRPERDVSMHDMRHTWFSWLLNDLGLARKVPAISKMGGHSNIERTWKYVRVGSEAGRDAVYESLDLTSPSGREDEVRAWLTRAPVMHQVEPTPQRSSTAADLGL